MGTMLNVALRYADQGLRVFPCRVQDKRPAVYNGVLRATVDPNVMAGWWKDTDYNIGIATGMPSGIFVVDVDGEDGDSSMAMLERRHGVLPATAKSHTGRGVHVWLQLPPGKDIRNSVCKLAPGVDIRGTGGYVIAPPSVHPSGALYAWDVDAPDTFAEPPQWLLDMLIAPTLAAERRGTPAEDWQQLIRNGVGEGARNDTIARLAGHLLRRWIDPHVTLELLLAFNEARCRPPLDADEVVTSVTSILEIELKRRGINVRR